MTLYDDLMQLKSKEMRHITDSTRNLTCFKYAHPNVDWNNPLLRSARGLVLAPDGTVVLHPYDKFFNLDQLQLHQESMREITHDPDLVLYEPQVLALSAWQNVPIESITEKMDGSLVTIAYREPYGLLVATSGNIRPDNCLIQEITDYIKQIGLDRKLRSHPDWTLIGEYYSLSNQLALHYDQKTHLWLHGARMHYTGHLNDDPLVDYHHLQQIAHELDLEIVKQYHFDDLSQMQTFLHHARQMEGFVVTFTNGIKLKLKADEYLNLKVGLDVMFGGLSVNKLLNLMDVYRDNQFDDLRSNLVQSPYYPILVSVLNDVVALSQYLTENIDQNIPLALKMTQDREFRKQRFCNHQVNEFEQLLLNNFEPNGQLSDETRVQIETDYIKKHAREIITKMQARLPQTKFTLTQFINPHY